MSGTQVSGFADPNILYKSLSGLGTAEVQRNQLLNQAEQQNITDHDIAAVGQAAAPLLNLNEDQAAAAYPGWLQDQQSRGIAKYAPPTYPGHAAVQALVQRAMPILQQIQTGYITPPGSADATKRLNDIYTGAVTPPATASTGTPPTAPGPPGLATAESGGRSDVINPQGYTGTYQFGKQRLADLGYYTPAPGENMGDNTTWAGKVSVPGFNVTDQKSFAANPAAQQVVYQTHMANIDKAIDQMPNAGNFDRNGLRAVAHLGGIAGMERFASSGGMYDPADANGTRLSSYYKRFSGAGPPTSVAQAGRPPAVVPQGGVVTATASAPVITGDSLASSGGLGGSGVVGDSSAKVLARVQAESRAGKYDGKPVVLSTGASNDFGSDLGSVEQQLREAQAGNAGKITVLGVGPSVEAKAPGTNAKLAALSKAYGADFVPLPADQMSPDGVHPTAQGYATLKAAVTPPQGAPGGGGQPGRYQVASNAPVAPPASTAPAGGDLVGPRPLPPIGPGSPVVTPQSLANTPAPQQQAQVPQPPTNRTMPGSPDGPPAPTPPPVQQPPPATRGNLPHAADVPQGLNSPQLQQAQRLRQAASQIEVEAAQNPYDKRLQAEAAAKAADLKQRAQSLEQSDTVVQTQDGQLHVATGKIDEPAKPLPHYVYDSTQHAYIDTTGTNKPEFEPAQRDSAVAQRDVMELGPKVANGTATQQEQARYATAVETYRQSKIVTDPITKGLIRVNERELPAGFPEPPGLGDGGRPGGVSAASGPQTITPGMSPAQQEVERKLGENFADQDTKAYAGANNSLYALGQMNNASEILDKQGGSAWTATGPAANLRIATAQGVNTLGSLFGVAPTFDPAAIGSWEALNKQTKLMGFKIINAAFGASREAASVINNATSAVPSAENTYLGFRLVSSGIEQELQRERELYEFKADRVRSGQPLATAEADFNKTHPIDVYTSRAIANAVPDDIAGYLVAHPDTVKAFDGHFGPGTGEFILKGGRTGLGQAARGR